MRKGHEDIPSGLLFSASRPDARNTRRRGLFSLTTKRSINRMTKTSDSFESSARQKQTSGASTPDAAIARLIKNGIAREDAGDLKGAIEIHHKILQLDPRNIYAMTTIAGLFGKLGEFEQEITWAQKAIAIDPQFDLAYINSGNALAGLKKFNEAADAYKKAIRINPQNPLGVYGLGVIGEDQGNFKKALEFYQQSIQIDPMFENGYFNLAVMHANLKQFDEAVAALKKLIELNPQAEDAKAILRQIEKER
jgi:tetratricopeptide (TPR) repeat protein